MEGYKQTVIGLIPEDWEVKDISALCLLQRGFDITESTTRVGDVPVYSSSGLAYFHNEAKVHPPGVVTGRKGILGKVFYIEEPFWPHDTTLWVKDFKGNDAKYVSFFLTYFNLERFDAATSVPTLNRNNLIGISIHVPPLPEQKTIAQSLSDVDALIAGCDRLITKKRHIKQGTMQQLLTGKKRLPGFSGEWEVKKLGEIFDFKNGLNKEKKYFGVGTPIVNYMDVYKNRGLTARDLKGKVTVTEKELKAYQVHKDDVFFTRTSETVDEIGISSVILEDLDNTVFSGFVLRAK
jgi:type I restriction enzyme S subunit